ncbi:MAG: hypothetical protein AAGC53_07400 [Actinomycetota bacterium]
MTHLGYLIAGWSISLGALALYALRITSRGRKLAARVPVERRRWMTAEDSS